MITLEKARMLWMQGWLLEEEGVLIGHADGSPPTEEEYLAAWSVANRARRKRLMPVLEEMLKQLLDNPPEPSDP